MRKSQAIKTILAGVPEDRRDVAEKLATELTFVEKTLKRLRARIEEDGELEQYENGSQTFLRESPALKAYNQTLQRYSVIYRQIVDMMNKPQEAPQGGLAAFIREGLE